MGSGSRGWWLALGLTLGLTLAPRLQAAEPLCHTDIDGNGAAAPATDAQLLLRHLFGLTGQPLIQGVVGAGCTRCTAAELTAYLDSPACQFLFDVDGNGRRDALTDGLLVWRALAGLSGTALSRGALAEDARRTDPEVLSDWLARGVLPAGEAPWRVQLVAGNALVGDRIELEWLTTVDNDTPVDALRYVLHAATSAGYIPSASTAKGEVVDAAYGTLTGLSPDTLYYVKVEAVDAQGNSSWSNALSVLTAAADPAATSTPRQVLDTSNALDPVVTAASVSYRLPAGATPPPVGGLILSTLGDGYLRRVTGVQINGEQITLQTAAADLSETFSDVQLSSEVKLIDLPSEQTLSGLAALRSLTLERTQDERRIHWPERGLTLSQRFPAPASAAQAGRPSATATPCDGTGGAAKTETDSPLEVRYPAIACVEPGGALQLDIEVAIQSGEEAQYQITQLQFEKLVHPKISKWRDNYGATWSQPNAASDTQGTGRLSWRPDDHHVDDAGRPFTAHFIALAKEREGHCTGALGLYCATRRIDFEIPIYVNWGELPEPTDYAISEGNAKLTLSGNTRIDYQPAVTVTADLSGAHLREAVARVDGPVAFRTEVRLQASADASYQSSRALLDKRFLKILWVGEVPIVISGRLQLRAEFRAQAEAALDIRQVLELGLDLTGGLRYHDGDWEVLSEASPWQRYTLHGEADGRAFLEMRFVPDLQLKFYEVVGGRLVLEPYLDAEARLEGHFDSDGHSLDADYRFTQLDFGVGADAGFRLGLEAFGKGLVGYPSNDPDDLHRFSPLARTRMFGLPTLTPSAGGALVVANRCALGLSAQVTPVPNPFQSLLGGPSTFLPFEPDSARWQVVSPTGEVTLTPGSPATQAWLSAASPGQYRVRFSGHSALGSFVRQYQELTVTYDPAALACGVSASPWATPASGAWTDTPQWLRVGSDGAEVIYYRMVNTYDGSTPADPAAPTPTANDGTLTGPEADFQLYGNPGKLKRSKLRLVGCRGGTCGPVSPVYPYSIDLRGGAAVSVTPASGAWSSTPQWLAVASAGASDLYYRMVNTYDGSTPADPGTPSPTQYDGRLSGPEAGFLLYGSTGQLKRSKLRLVGCAGSSCGPVSGVFGYSIDLRGVATVPGVGPLNDTGIDWCADGASNFLSCPVDGYPWQDAQDGRDAHLDDDRDGHAGFSFTKLDANGNALSVSATHWSCVRDNVTGRVWEVKTDDGGLHDRDDRYTWYNPDAASNGGFAGYADDDGDVCYGYDANRPASYCNTQAYVARVNSQGLCGARDWRLPSREELLSIVSDDRYWPSIDTAFFPNTESGWFWSSSPYAGSSSYAWGVNFYSGYVYYYFKNYAGYVRLVRGGQ